MNNIVSVKTPDTIINQRPVSMTLKGDEKADYKNSAVYIVKQEGKPDLEINEAMIDLLIKARYSKLYIELLDKYTDENGTLESATLSNRDVLMQIIQSMLKDKYAHDDKHITHIRRSIPLYIASHALENLLTTKSNDNQSKSKNC